MPPKLIFSSMILVALCVSNICFAAGPPFAGPPLQDIQQQIDQLNTEINALQSQLDQQSQQPVLVDSADTKVGDVVIMDYDFETFDSQAAVISVAPNSGIEANIYYTTGGGFRGALVLYDQERCQGNIIGIEERGGLIVMSGVVSYGRPPTGITVYVPDTSNPATPIEHISDRSGSLCRTVASPNTLTTIGYPLLQTIDLSGSNFVPPYRILVTP